jgi:hypothetical protein
MHPWAELHFQLVTCCNCSLQSRRTGSEDEICCCRVLVYLE